MKRRVLLFGPDSGDFAGAYGGGMGGYTRNMQQYVYRFHSDEFELVPCYHTISGQGGNQSMVVRFFIDFFRFIKSIRNVQPTIVHILAQYRTAVPREFAVVWICRLLSKPVIYEVKAGSFPTWFYQTNRIFRSMAKYCIRKADTVLCEGYPTVELIYKDLNIKGVYYPNFVSLSEIPPAVPEKLTNNKLRVMFIGYAIREKGVYELVEGCNIAAQQVPVELDLIGQEHFEFTKWIDHFPLHVNLKINRWGKLPHDKVMTFFDKNDIYCYPTRHPGEGHNNSINEAMMHGMVIVTTRHGFLASVLEDTAYFIPEITPEAIAEKLVYIKVHPMEAREKSRMARAKLSRQFTDVIAFHTLELAYRKAVLR